MNAQEATEALAKAVHDGEATLRFMKAGLSGALRPTEEAALKAIFDALLEVRVAGTGTLDWLNIYEPEYAVRYCADGGQMCIRETRNFEKNLPAALLFYSHMMAEQGHLCSPKAELQKRTAWGEWVAIPKEEAASILPEVKQWALTDASPERIGNR